MEPSLWLLIVVLCLATHRVTRLITRDQLPLIGLPREKFVTRWGAAADAPDSRISYSGRKTNLLMRSLAYLWECDWCMSIWVSMTLTALTWLWTPLGDEHTWVAVLVGAMASTVTGLIAQSEPD